MARSSAKKTATVDDLGARNGPWTGRGSCGSTTAICGPVGVGAGGAASPRGPRVMGDARGRSTRSRSACSFRGARERDRARSGRPVGGGARRLRVASRVGSRSTAYASMRGGVHVVAPACVRRWVTASAAGATLQRRVRHAMQRFTSTDHCRCAPLDVSTSWSSCTAIYAVSDADKVPDGRRERLGREAADGRRGLLRPRPGPARGSCGTRVHRRSRPPPRTAKPLQGAPWTAARGPKWLIFA